MTDRLGAAPRPAAARAAVGLLAVLLALWTVVASPLAALEVPYLAGRVNDLADMLPPDAESRIEARLERLETERGAQVAVLTIPSLEGEALEEYSLRVAETWQLGRAEHDDGALLLIARDDRRMRLEVGYGLEPTLTDLTSHRILDDVLAPRFRQGDFAGGIEEAVDVIARLVEGEDALPPPSAGAGSGGRQSPGQISGFLLAVGFFSLMALGSRGCGGWLLFLVLIPFWFTVPLSLWGSPLGLIPGVLWILGFPVAWYLFGRSSLGKRWTSGGGGWSSSSGGWGGFSGGGGGGFSGGGGSFGGGGSSGSW